MGSGTLQGDELTALKENAPRLVQAIADGLGVSQGALKKMGEDGALSAKNKAGNKGARLELFCWGNKGARLELFCCVSLARRIWRNMP
jgi:hypothetical protein